MMKKIKICIITLVCSMVIIPFDYVQSQEMAQVPCLKKDGGIGLNGIDRFDCNLMQATVNNQVIKEQYKKEINKNLANKLHVRLTQGLEEIGLLDRYFTQINLDLMKNSPAVASSCRLDVIANPACSPEVKASKEYKDKLKALQATFIKDPANPDPTFDKDLTKQLIKFSMDTRAITSDANSCPAKGSTGYFFLESQFTETAALQLITTIKERNSIDAFLINFPQLKMLKDAAAANHPGALDAYAQFRASLDNYDAAKDGTPKAFVEKQFKDESKQIQLANALADKCKDIASNVDVYLCKELDHLAMPAQFAESFFSKNDDADIDIAISKGFSCKYVEHESNNEDLVTMALGNNVQSWDQKFSANTRTVPRTLDLGRVVDDFCATYHCSNPANPTINSLPSCRSGGPVTSDDLFSLCINGCDSKIAKAASFLKSLEIESHDIQLATSSNGAGNSSDGSPTGSSGYSTFYQNFIGVERPVSSRISTPLMEDIQNNDRTITPPVIAHTPALDTTKTQKEAPKNNNTVNSNVSRNQEMSETFTSNSQSDNVTKRSLSAPGAKSLNDSSTAKSRKAEYASQLADSSRLEEMKKLRSELTDAINKVKGTDEEKLGAIADNNRVVTSGKNSSDTTKNMSPVEKERMDQYKESLSSWENRLKNWQSDLNTREFNRGTVKASGSSSSAPVAPTTASSTASSQNNFSNNSNDSSDNSGSTSSALKLTKTGSGANGQNGKNEGTAERAPGSEAAESELDVVSSESLSTLRKESLKNFGIVAKDSFIIKVRYQDKIYAIPVKTFTYQGKSMYVPLLNDKNRELSTIVFESPLFSDYRKYQVERQYSQENP